MGPKLSTRKEKFPAKFPSTGCGPQNLITRYKKLICPAAQNPVQSLTQLTVPPNFPLSGNKEGSGRKKASCGQSGRHYSAPRIHEDLGRPVSARVRSLVSYKATARGSARKIWKQIKLQDTKNEPPTSRALEEQRGSETMDDWLKTANTDSAEGGKTMTGGSLLDESGEKNLNWNDGEGESAVSSDSDSSSSESSGQSSDSSGGSDDGQKHGTSRTIWGDQRKKGTASRRAERKELAHGRQRHARWKSNTDGRHGRLVGNSEHQK